MTDIARDVAPSTVRRPFAPAVSVALVGSESEARAAVGVLSTVWPRADGADALPPELAWALAHSGNYVAVAKVGTDVVGCAAGFRGADDDGPFLHSHILGVRPEHQGARIGFALKQHQRSWALSAGLDRITWTFDPLVARNAYFNVTKLGASLTRYYVDFYGRMDDGINDGDETDRCLVTWRLESPRAVGAAHGTPVPAGDLGAAAAVELLGADPDGRPLLAPSGALAPSGPPTVPSGEASAALLVTVPPDVVSLRHTDPGRAAEWRRAARQAFGAAFAAGYEVVEVHRTGTYVLKCPV